MNKFKEKLKLDLGELLSKEQQRGIKGGYSYYGYLGNNGKVYCSLAECYRCTGGDPNNGTPGTGGTCVVITTQPCFFGGC